MVEVSQLLFSETGTFFNNEEQALLKNFILQYDNKYLKLEVYIPSLEYDVVGNKNFLNKNYFYAD
jgi:hypothetical protein